MRRALVLLFLQLYAVCLAFMQSLGGVRTDEAKYLLNIPYPHPPLVRYFISLTETFQYQELLWRLVLATALVFAVLFIYELAKSFTKEQRLVLCGMWLTASAVVLQAGTIMMAPLTALQGLVFIALWLQRDAGTTGQNYPLVLSLFWLTSLFTAYQSVLYAPIVFILFWRMHSSLYARVVAFCGPLFLLALYTVTNPLVLESMVSAGTQNTVLGIDEVFYQTAKHFLVGGGVVLSILGVMGMVQSKSWSLLLSLVLVLVYVSLSSRVYYPILFTPLFVGGVLSAPRLIRMPAFIFALHLLCSGYIIFQNVPITERSQARTISNMLQGRAGEYLLIEGSFGHEWQYESSLPVRRFKTSLLNKAAAVVCIDSCSELGYFGWKQVENTSTEVWFKKSPTVQTGE